MLASMAYSSHNNIFFLGNMHVRTDKQRDATYTCIPHIVHTKNCYYVFFCLHVYTFCAI